jgi:hypothetical protein
MTKGLKAFLVALAACANLHAATLFSEDFEHGLGKRWEPVKFEGTTEYTVIKDGGSSVLQAHAVSSASGLGAKADFETKPNTAFTWRWKLDKTPPGGSDDTKRTFDHTVRLFVAFKTLIGPPRTINYVWANKTPVGKTFHHPSSGRARFIVLESGDEKAGKWIKESRDLYADWKLLFGNDDPPAVVSVGLMTDSDGTASTVTGWYDDLLISAP